MSKQSRRDLHNAKREYVEARSKLKTAIKNKNLSADGTDIAQLKNRVKSAKLKKKEAIQRNGGSVVKKASRAGHLQASSMLDSALQEDEGLEGISSSRQRLRRTNAELRQAKRIGRYTQKVGKNAGRATYNLSNRGYNLIRGRGFTRTAVNDRWEVKVKNKYQKSRLKLQKTKVGKVAEKAKTIATYTKKPIIAVLKNPLSSKAYIIMFLGVLLIALLGAITGGGSSTVTQNEFDLNDTWIYLSKIDREKSNDKVDYWTDIDSIMMFMGYKHEDYTLNTNYDSKDKKWYQFKHSYRSLLTTLWNDLNGDMENLKTMSDIYTSTNNKYLKLTKEEQKEYEEVYEQSKELGYYISYNDLENPLSNKPDDDTIPPITVTKRFGYVSKDKIYNGSILKADKGSPLYSVMEGKVKIKGSDIVLKTKSEEFTYKNVSRLRIKDGDTIKSGLEIGTVGSNDGQEVYYRKLKNKQKNEWVWVNVGFYMPKVEYSQTTSVMTDMSIEGDIAKKNYLNL
ncbi:M23 family metallopeptidase [Streptococcus uberis]|nr:M23 family metallopeptidase [Streptococcus uberis]